MTSTQGPTLTMSRSQATKQASVPAPRVGQVGGFGVSLGNLAEPKGFGSPVAQVLSQGFLTPDKASGQYRNTKLTEIHRKKHRDTVKTTTGGHHTPIHLNRQHPGTSHLDPAYCISSVLSSPVCPNERLLNQTNPWEVTDQATF